MKTIALTNSLDLIIKACSVTVASQTFKGLSLVQLFSILEVKIMTNLYCLLEPRSNHKELKAEDSDFPLIE